MSIKASIIAAAGLAIGIAAVNPAVAGDRCLEFKQIKATHMVSPTTMHVTTLRNERYTVRFTAACRVGKQYSWNHFEYTDLLVGQCLNARDVLPTSELGPCVVQSVERQAG